MRVSQRLTLGILLVICAVFLAHAWLGIRWHEALYRQDVQRDQRVLGRTLASAVGALWDEYGPEGAVRLVSRSDEERHSLRIRWLAASDLATTLPEPVRADGVARLQEGRELDVVDGSEPERMLLFFPVEREGRLVGAIEIAESLETERAYVRVRLFRAGFTTLMMILVSGVLSWVLGERLVGRPIRQLIEKARRVGGGDFAGPIDLGRRGEFAELAAEMNAMAERLQGAWARIESESRARTAALEQLRHADRLTTVGRLASGVAHELGTPLNVVAERARVIESGEAVSTEEVVTCARIIRRQAQRMTDTVRQLLDFARRRRPERCPTELRELVVSTVRLVQPILDKRRVGIRTRLPEAPVVARIDPGQIQQALTNLLTNAVDVTTSGGSVEVELVPAGSDREGPSIAVRDTGPGIPAEVLPQIFDPFYTTKEVGQGTGLGLSVSDGLVAENGGTIEVRTGAGGSTFTIRLEAP